MTEIMPIILYIISVTPYCNHLRQVLVSPFLYEKLSLMEVNRSAHVHTGCKIILSPNLITK